MGQLSIVVAGAAVALIAVPVLACDRANNEERAAARAAAFTQADANGDGVLNAEEFAVLYETMKARREQRLFTRLDTNADGQVSVEEIQDAHLRRGGPPQ